MWTETGLEHGPVAGFVSTATNLQVLSKGIFWPAE